MSEWFNEGWRYWIEKDAVGRYRLHSEAIDADLFTLRPPAEFPLCERVHALEAEVERLEEQGGAVQARLDSEESGRQDRIDELESVIEELKAGERDRMVAMLEEIERAARAAVNEDSRVPLGATTATGFAVRAKLAELRKEEGC